MKQRIIFPVIILLFFGGCRSEKKVNEGEEGWQASMEVVERLSERHPEINYYESKVPDYTLPDPLTALDGDKVRTGKMWRESRREEILELFRENVYGRIPDTHYTKSFSLVNSDNNTMDGDATLKQVDIIINSGEDTLVIHLSLFVPNKGIKPVPVFLLINNRDPENIDPTRQKKSEFWPAEEVISRGYAIAAWAWGASRCMDYFENDKDIDNKKVAVVGHSRGGKTALWAGAQDERFSIVISGKTGFHIREGAHNMLLKDWNWFMDFADNQWNSGN